MHRDSARHHHGVMAGLTTRVAFGSLWGFSGQWAALLTSLVATPFVIRLLGTDLYGVLGLVNVLMGYVSVAGVGMGQAATRFGAAEHARQDEDAEAHIFWTALAAMVFIAGGAAVALIVFAPLIVERVLGLRPALHDTVIAALRVAAIGFVARALAGVLSAPHLIRLRLGLVALIDSGCGVLQIALVPVVLWLAGAALVPAVAVGAAVNVLAAALHAGVALRALPRFRRPTIRPSFVGPLLRFSLLTSFMALSGLILLNLEKVVLVRLISPAALAYYSVAFTVARLLAVLPASTSRSLLPAFSRLDLTRDAHHLQSLYARALRGLFLWTVPLALAIGSVAAPFLAAWAGAEYGRESALPLYILLAGCALDGLSYVPRTLLSAAGRPDLVARFHAFSLVPYAMTVVGLVQVWGPAGAAAAWTLRAATECLITMGMAKRTLGVSATFLPRHAWVYLVLLLGILVPAWLLAVTNGYVRLGLAVGTLAIVFHGIVAWQQLVEPEERQWALLTVRRTLGGRAAQ